MPKRKITKTKHKPEIKGKNEVHKIIIFCVLVLLLALIAGLVFTQLSTKENKNTKEKESNENFSFYDEERCRCVERNRLRCFDDSWQLDEENRLCRQGNNVTNVILACSEYECSGVLYEFNKESQMWEAKSGG